MAEVIRIALSNAEEDKLKVELRRRVRQLRDGHRDLHENRLLKWRRAYEAVPAEALREFPFYRASNTVIPLTAIHCDTLLARLMAAIFKTRPLWYVKVLGLHLDKDAEGHRESLEDFLAYVGIEPTELDLYRVYHEWFGETIRYGTGIVKVPWETDIEHVVVPAGDGFGKYDFLKQTMYDGPRPEKVAFDDFMVPPAFRTLGEADLKVHIKRLNREQMLFRQYSRFYDPMRVNKVLKTPDRTSPRHIQTVAESDAGARTQAGYGWGEWDIYECWWKKIVNGRKVKLIISYHEKSDTIVRALYNFYPDNIEPFSAARLFYRDNLFYGYGFAERLWQLQEEISQIHNERRDNQTVANTRVWRVNPDSKLHEGYRIYPSAMLPAEKDEIEPMAHGEINEIQIEEERLLLELAERLTGVSPPQQGYGAGVMHGRRGVYTAQGTLALMQEANTRTELNITDMRYAHTKLGRMLCKMYSWFGVGDRAELFGDKGKLIAVALEGIKSGRLGLPVYAATASINREVEKQNDLMLVGVMNQHYNMMASLLQAASNQMMPEGVKTYLKQVMIASETMMKDVLRAFGRSEPERLIPEASKNAETGGESQGSDPLALPPGGGSVQ